MALSLLSLSGATALVCAYGQFFDFPDELALKDEVSHLELKYGELGKALANTDKVLEAIQLKDDKLYRPVLGAQPIDESIREAGVGGSDRYSDIRARNILHEHLIISLHEEADKLGRKLNIEFASQDYVLRLARQKRKLYAALPAIRPISGKDLVRLASGFGMRRHPIRKENRMHYGVDLSATVGTPVYATADGTVTITESRRTGYGKMIEISHGFGYKTRYGHLSGFAVKKGDRVKRGDVIGYVGSTGLSTGPHLHYEILIHDQPVNPAHYFSNDLTEAEFEQLVQSDVSTTSRYAAGSDTNNRRLKPTKTRGPHSNG